MNKLLAVVVLLLASGNVVAAQVKWKVVFEGGDPAAAKPTAKLTVTLAAGWHISSLTQPEGGPVRTEISPSKDQPFKLAGEIIAPKPHKEHSAAFDMEVETYTGVVVFTLPLVATADIQPGTKLTVQITYQACNDETCLLPKTETVSCIISEEKKLEKRRKEAPTKKP